MDLILRPASTADLPALCGLLTELFAIESDFVADPQRQQRGLELLLGRPADALVLVAEQAGQVVGMATVQLLISTAEGGPAGLVEDVVVSQTVRGGGIGRALLQGLAHWAAGQGATRLQLLADLDNTPALDFYRHLGWQATRLGALRLPLPR